MKSAIVGRTCRPTPDRRYGSARGRVVHGSVSRYFVGHAVCPTLLLAPTTVGAPSVVRGRRVLTAPGTACVGGFYVPGRPASPDAVTCGAPYARSMTVTTQINHRGKSLPVERSARSNRRAVPRVRPKGSSGRQHGIAGPSHVAGTASPDRGTRPAFWWQAVGATYDDLPSASKRLCEAEPSHKQRKPMSGQECHIENI